MLLEIWNKASLNNQNKKFSVFDGIYIHVADYEAL